MSDYLTPDQRRRRTGGLMAAQYDRATPEEGNVAQRHGLLPLATYDNGKTGLAFPGFVAEPVESFNRLLQNGYTPGDSRGVEDAFNVAGAAMMGGLAAPRPRGSIGMSGMPESALDMSQAARMAHWGDIEHNGKYYSINELAQLAKDLEYEGLTVRNVIDTKNAREVKNPATTRFLFNNTDVRSVNAAHDPAQRNSANLLYANGGRPGAATGAALGSIPETSGIRAYHGTKNANFNEFDPQKIGSSQKSDDASVAPALFFDTNPRGTDPYIANHRDRVNTVENPFDRDYYRVGDGSATIPVSIKPSNIFVSNHMHEPYPTLAGGIMEEAFAKGHDAVRFDITKGMNDKPQSIYAVSAENGKGTVYSALTGDLLYANGGRTGAGLGAAVGTLDNSSVPGIRAYHGSPHDFDKFDISKIGTGEGAQAYGHGLYFAENEGVAGWYKDKLDNAKLWDEDVAPHLDGAPVNNQDLIGASVWSKNEGGHVPAADKLRYYAKQEQDRISAIEKRNLSFLNKFRSVPDGGDPTSLGLMRDAVARYERMASKLDELAASGKDFEYKVPSRGRMYEVNIKANPDDFLDWDKPLSQQSEKVQSATRQYMNLADGSRMADIGWKNISGRPIEEAIGNVLRTDTAGLREAGIPGIRYLDQNSRAAGEGTSNYVVFDPATIEILRKYGLLGMAGGAAAEIMGQGQQPKPQWNQLMKPGDA